ncbi:MAG: DUF739 family protein [Roseburia sp.]|nr:DUF739 family protein [Roseburia sp.]
MAYDYSKLMGRITEKFGTRGRFSAAMGMSERSMSLKLNGKVPFKQPEISKACSLLDIEEADIYPYFFTLEVQKA